MEEILKKSMRLAEKIENQKEILIENLLDYESYETAEDEIKRSLDCLLNIRKEIKYLANCHVGSMSVFLPVNLPLYSLILFGIIPGYFSDIVYLRPPVLARQILDKIYQILDIEVDFPNIKRSYLERSLFLESYVSLSDVVLFTGTFQNATSVRNSCKQDSLFIYNGAGINPIVIGQDANLDLAVEKTIQTRVFNSGQDCAGPDSILVHSSIINEFLGELTGQLSLLKVGKYVDREVRVGSLVSSKRVEEVGKILSANFTYIKYGGHVDFRKLIVYPTVLVSEICQRQNFFEWFSPVFDVGIFKGEDELGLYFQRSIYRDFSMYVSIFGNISSPSLGNSVVLKDKNILDIERGNNAYGGYGRRANFVYYHLGKERKYICRPILISREVYEWTSSKSL